MTFFELLANRINSIGSVLCIGLDPDPSRLPLHLQDEDLPLWSFNRRIIDAVTEKLGIPSEKTFINIEKYGNTSSASIPIAMHEACEAGLIKPGCLTLLVVVGAGLTWGAALIRW